MDKCEGRPLSKTPCCGCNMRSKGQPGRQAALAATGPPCHCMLRWQPTGAAAAVNPSGRIHSLGTHDPQRTLVNTAARYGQATETQCAKRSAQNAPVTCGLRRTAEQRPWKACSFSTPSFSSRSAPHQGVRKCSRWGATCVACRQGSLGFRAKSGQSFSLGAHGIRG